MAKNNFKMRCVEVDKPFNPLYTKGKIYECINGKVKADNGELGAYFNSFEEFQKWSKSEWELVEDIVKTITINISDYKSTITDSNGVELCIKFIDKHDEKYVINKLTKRYIAELDRTKKENNSIKIGDYIVIIDNDATYTTPNGKWFDGIDMKYRLKFAYNILPDNSEVTKYRVVAIIDEDNYNLTKYLISNGISTFLLAEYGVRKVE